MKLYDEDGKLITIPRNHYEAWVALDVTGFTADQWTAIDLSALIPADAAVVEVLCYNESGTTAYNAGVRKSGSGLTLKRKQMGFKASLSFTVEVGKDRKIELYPDDVTNCTFFITGYWI